MNSGFKQGVMQELLTGRTRLVVEHVRKPDPFEK